MTKKFVLLLIAVILILFIATSWLLIKLNRTTASPTYSPYSVIYLSSGDIYFGKLTWFPKPKLKNVWFIQRSVNPQSQEQLGVAPLSSVFWGPVDEIYLNSKEIVFWAKLRSDSQLAAAIAARNLGGNLNTPNQPLVPQTPN